MKDKEFTEESLELQDIEDINDLAYSLVNWDNAPTVADLRHDLDQATASHSEHVANVAHYLNVINGKLTKNIPEGRSRIVPKTVKKQNAWKKPSLVQPYLSSPDMFNVNPSTFADTAAAKQHEQILNKQFRTDIPRVEFINDYVSSAVDIGTTIVKLSWEEISGIVIEEYEEPVYAETPEERQAFVEQQVNDGVFTPEIGQALLQSNEPLVVEIEKKTREVTKVIHNRPVLEVKDTRTVIIDPTCRGNIDKANFIIDSFVTDLSTLRKDGRYSNLEHINVDLGPVDTLTNPELYNDLEQFEYQDSPRKKLIAHEYWGFWDIHNTGIVEPIVATFIGDVMIRLEANPFPDKKLPYVIVKYALNTELDTIYGEPDVALIDENQEIIAAITRGVLDHFGRVANAQQGFAKGFLDERNLDRFRKGQDYFFNPTMGGLQNSYVQSAYPQFPQGAMDLLTLQNREVESTTGTVAFSQGVSGQALGDSVGGIKSALDATAKREANVLQRLSQGLIEIGKKIISMNSLWLTDEEIIRITDEDFVTISRSTLASGFDLSITISTAEEDNFKAQELAFMLQTLGNNFDFNIVKLVLMKIADLRKLPDLVKAIEEYEPQPDPIAVEEAQLRIELLKAQIATEHTKSAENQADIELKLRKAITEEMKAGQIKSDKDQKDLNFVEQATGLSHERELEKLKMNKAEKEKQATSQSKSKPKTTAKPKSSQGNK